METSCTSTIGRLRAAALVFALSVCALGCGHADESAQSSPDADGGETATSGADGTTNTLPRAVPAAREPRTEYPSTDCAHFHTYDPVRIGGDGALAVAAAAEGAPEGGAFVAASVLGDESAPLTLTLQHLDVRGNPVGRRAMYTLETTGVVDLAVHAFGSGYGIVLTSAGGDDSGARVVATHVGATLESRTDAVALQEVRRSGSSGDPPFDDVALAAGPHALWVAYRHSPAAPARDRIVVAGLDPEARKFVVDTTAIDRSDGAHLKGPPAIEVVSGVPTVVYREGRPTRIRGVRLRNGRVASRFDARAGRPLSEGTPGSVALFELDGVAHLATLVDPAETAASSAIRYWRLDRGPRNSPGSGTDLPLGSSATAAAFGAVDRGDTTGPDRIVAAWSADDGSETARVGGISTDDPRSPASRVVRTDDASPNRPRAVVAHEDAAAALVGRTIVAMRVVGSGSCTRE